MDWDNVGLQVGAADAPANRVLVVLDATLSALAYAQKNGFDVVLAHHPLTMTAERTLISDNGVGERWAAALRAGIAVVSAHTNWDAAPGGVSDTMARDLGLADVSEFGPGAARTPFKLVTFVTRAHEAALRQSLAAAGAGIIGAYQNCAFTSDGTGHFTASADASPFAGQAGLPNEIAETRIEMHVPFSRRGAVEAALLASHPYETPAYDLIPLVASPEHRLGRLGTVTREKFEDRIRDAFKGPQRWWGQLPNKETLTVGVSGGAASELAAAAFARGADVFVTGEVKHHLTLDLPAEFLLVEAGHFATEYPAMPRLSNRLSELLRSVEFQTWSPEPGRDGRPASLG